MQEWLLGCFWPFYIFAQSTQLYTFHYHILECRCLKNVIRQIDSKSEWLHLPARFSLKFLWNRFLPHNKFFCRRKKNSMFDCSKTLIYNFNKRTQRNLKLLIRRCDVVVTITTTQFNSMQSTIWFHTSPNHVYSVL